MSLPAKTALLGCLRLAQLAVGGPGRVKVSGRIEIWILSEITVVIVEAAATQAVTIRWKQGDF
jgi:hypothetical protein